MIEKRLPEGWEIKRVADIAANIQYGYTESAKSEVVGPKFLRITDIQNNVVNWDSVPYCSITEAEKKKYLLKPGDLVFARTGATVGKSYLVGESLPEAVFASYLIRLQLCTCVDPNYVNYFFQSPYYWLQITKGQVGAGQPSFNSEKLSNITLPIPPLDTQRKIVAILEKAEATQRLRTEADALTRQLIRSNFTEFFGDLQINPMRWEEIKLGDVILETRNGLYKSEEHYGNGIPILRMYNILNNQIIMNKVHKIEVSESEYQEYKLEPGDILFNRVNSPVWLGKSAVIPKNIGRCVFESKNIRIKVDKTVANPEYIVHYLGSPLGRQEILKRAKHAVNQSTVNNKDIREFKLPLPPIDLQNRFASFLESVESLQSIFFESSIELEKLNCGLTVKAFNGELVV